MEKHVAIIHPDLGIGGAEQLIVNIGLALKLTKFNVTIFTPRHEKSRSFKPTHDGSLSVHVKGNVFPSSIFGKFIAFCSMIRMFFASLYVVLFGGKFDYIIVDQVSSILPVFFFTSSKVIFYCHFPDQLLCTQRTSRLKRAYRYVLDRIEEIGLWTADLIFVNSKFTQGITLRTFKSIKPSQISILYPCIDLNFPRHAGFPKFLCSSPYFFSLNRYERKKNINLAIESFASLPKRSAKLLIGGGYDPQLPENLQHFEELRKLCDKLKLTHCEVSNWENAQPGYEVYFAKNLTETQREEALKNAICVIYTPENEHFGIVPVEAMARGTPVIASNSGGPTESVKDGVCGFLLERKVGDWAQKMDRLQNESKLRESMGSSAKTWAAQEFSLKSMGEKLKNALELLR